MTRFQNEVCLVNGAASEIGQAVAGRFADEGGTVVGVDQVEPAAALPLDGGITQAFTVPE